MKKQRIVLPEVHIHGDLQDVKNLIAGVNKKKTLVLFHNEEEGTFYLEIEGKFQQILQTDITLLEKEYKLIFFSFFPSRKKVEPLPEEKPELENIEKKDKKKKGEKKVKKAKPDKKGQKKK